MHGVERGQQLGTVACGQNGMKSLYVVEVGHPLSHATVDKANHDQPEQYQFVSEGLFCV